MRAQAIWSSRPLVARFCWFRSTSRVFVRVPWPHCLSAATFVRASNVDGAAGACACLARPEIYRAPSLRPPPLAPPSPPPSPRHHPLASCCTHIWEPRHCSARVRWRGGVMVVVVVGTGGRVGAQRDGAALPRPVSLTACRLGCCLADRSRTSSIPPAVRTRATVRAASLRPAARVAQRYAREPPAEASRRGCRLS